MTKAATPADARSGRRPTTPWRPLALALPAALVLVTAGCGSDDPVSEAAGTASSAASAAASAVPSAVPSALASAVSPSAGGSGGTMLMAVLGPGDAYTIGLNDASGAKVTTLKAGTYQVMVSDQTAIHNYHLTGPGVDQETTVPEKRDVTWTVTLQPGTYTYICDPHPRMVGTFTVT
ncbi:MAG TPA: plastocyanin/azurin family copper-binding protein [Mycobacteriales bacterium]|jgi:plastocyanin|nr:plastocyanin/azurin family copper-binding protein [Mycobacteriales bacterium]